MKADKILPGVLLLTFSFSLAFADTVRHHKVTEEDPLLPVELKQAETAIEKRDYATAEPLLQTVIAKNPNNYEAWFDLGFVFHALGRMEDSIAAYRKSVAAKPDVFESNLNLGLSLAQAHSPDAEQFLQAATRLTPASQMEEGRERAWLSLAHVVEGDKPDEAIEAYHHAEELQPTDPEPHLSAGQLLEKQNRIDGAIQEYTDALKLDPTSTQALTGLANADMRQRAYGPAEDALKKLIAAQPDNAVAHVQLGRVLAAEKQTDNAIAELQAGLKLLPGDQDAKQDLADLYASAGKYDKAEDLYRSVLAQKPNDPGLHDDAGKMMLKQRKFPEAEQEFLAAIKLKPDFGSAYGDLAVAADENKDYLLAIKAADARAKYLPEIPISFFLRATAFDHLHDYKKAALNYHQFLNIAGGKFPDQEWQARHRLISIEPSK